MFVSETAALRQQMDTLLSQDAIPVEELEVLAQLYNQHITNIQPAQMDAAEYADFLQKNLDWLNAFTDKLLVAKLAVAAELTKVHKGKKAKQGYSENI
jgi:hypothetical protein